MKKDTAVKKNTIERYIPSEIESKWQKIWREEELYKFDASDQRLKTKDKYYTLVELPYPSGDLHIGHWFTFVAPDVLSRLKRMQGYNVFFPMGYDAFGLPAENAAIKRGVHPKDWTEKNIETMTKQFETMGTMIDWDHVTITCKPEFYKWNQWIFEKMYEKGIAYRGRTLSNWCPTDQTVLANEHVEDGKCWRCGSVVIQKEVEQWFLKITDYAEKLLWPSFAKASAGEPIYTKKSSEEDLVHLAGNAKDWFTNLKTNVTEINKNVNRDMEMSGVEPDRLGFVSQSSKPAIPMSDTAYTQKTSEVNSATVEWPKSVMAAQNDWIGKKEGMIIHHAVIGMDLTFDTFTAFPAWSWADRFISMAPEHPLVKKLVKGTEYEKPVMEFVKEIEKQTELERKETTEKLGIFTGRYAKDPFGGPDMPIWLANFALVNFGTGIVRSSGHDPRDFEFATKYGIAFGEVVDRTDPTHPVSAHENKGILKNSGPFNGRDVVEVVPDVIKWIEEQGIGKRFVNYHLHDWSISRQRYWGTPVPMIYCRNCYGNKSSVSSHESLAKDQRPATSDLKYGVDYTEMDGEKYAIIPVPLDELPVDLPYDVDFTPKGKPPLASNDEWMKVECPRCGGDAKRDPETLDTFFDSSWYYYRYVDPSFKEGPFDKKLVAKLLPVDIYFGGGEHTLGHTLYARFFTKFFKDLGLVDFSEFAKKRVQHGIVLGPDGNKMSKSKGNVINPDDIVKEFGTDAVRVYLSFMMPYNATGPWAPGAMYGVFRFLKRVWELQQKLVIPSVVEGSHSRHSELDSESQEIAGPIRQAQDLQQARNDEKPNNPIIKYQSNSSDLSSVLGLQSSDLLWMHRTAKKVGEDIALTKFNTAVSELMKWLNYLEGKAEVGMEEYRWLLISLSPLAPHITEELWQLHFATASDSNVILGSGATPESKNGTDSGQARMTKKNLFQSIHNQSWPQINESLIVEDEITIVIQVNGKVRDQMIVNHEEGNIKENIEELAKKSEKVLKYLEGKTIKKVIFVPGKIVNFVVS